MIENVAEQRGERARMRARRGSWWSGVDSTRWCLSWDAVVTCAVNMTSSFGYEMWSL